MKLTSSARLRIVTIAVVAILTFGIGLFSTLHTFKGEISALNKDINGVADIVAANPDAALGAALFQIDNESLDVLLILHSHDGTDTVIRDTSRQLSEKIKDQQLDYRTQLEPQGGVSKGRHFQYAVIDLTDQETLFIAFDASRIHDSLSTNIRFTIIATLIAVVLAFLIFSFYIRRVRNRDDAAALARMQEFLGDASHELRTPLTVIKGYVEMLSKGQFTEQSDRDRAFGRVSHEIQRMESLIHDLLLLAELGESADRGFEKVDVSEIVSAYCADFQTLHSGRAITIMVTPELSILGNYDYIARYIQNALTNISRHTPADAAVRVTLEARGKKVLLIIEDGGAGLPEAQYGTKVRILNRFDKSRSRDNGGSGLGMSIMSGIIEKLGGTLTLRKSELGGLALEAELPISTE